jgi:hypothetical protein
MTDAWTAPLAIVETGDSVADRVRARSDTSVGTERPSGQVGRRFQ